MAHIKLADLTNEKTTVELLDGQKYDVLSITRSVQKRLEKVMPELDLLGDEEDSDKAVALIVGAIDIMLSPSNGGPPAKKLLLEAWKNDRLGLGQVRGLFDSVQEAAVARPI